MITADQLPEFFENVTELGDGLLRFQVVMGGGTNVDTTYLLSTASDLCLLFWLPNSTIASPSETLPEQAFAISVLKSSADAIARVDETPQKIDCPENEFGFSHVFLIGPDCHGCLDGDMDEIRDHLVQCFPIYDCEFSGSESPDDIQEKIFRSRLNQLQREPAAKILLKFDNPQTQARTRGKKAVSATLSTVLHEVEMLAGVTGGFVEIENFRGQTCCVRATSSTRFSIEGDCSRKGIALATAKKEIENFILDRV